VKVTDTNILNYGFNYESKKIIHFPVMHNMLQPLVKGKAKS
jgi:hypothetical protein